MGIDSWSRDNVDAYLCRRHRTPRQKLFAPCRVPGGPARGDSLSAVRITEGVRISDGREFTVVDNWKDIGDTQQNLGFEWVGRTNFMNIDYVDWGEYKVDRRSRSCGDTKTGGDHLPRRQNRYDLKSCDFASTTAPSERLRGAGAPCVADRQRAPAIFVGLPARRSANALPLLPPVFANSACCRRDHSCEGPLREGQVSRGHFGPVYFDP